MFPLRLPEDADPVRPRARRTLSSRIIRFDDPCRGERRRVELYEILAPKHGLSPERERSRNHYWTGVLHYRERQWDKAIEEFSKARITGIPDQVLDYYIRRVERSRRGEEEVSKDQMLLFSAS